MHLDTTWDVQAESCQKWPHPFSDEQTPWLADRQRLLVCSIKKSDVGTRGRLVVGVQGGHLKKGDGQRPCSIYGQKTRCPVSYLGYSVVSVLASSDGGGTKTRPRRQKTFSGKRGRLSCTEMERWKVERKDDVPDSQPRAWQAPGVWTPRWCCRLPKLVGTDVASRLPCCPTESRR